MEFKKNLNPCMTHAEMKLLRLLLVLLLLLLLLLLLEAEAALIIARKLLQSPTAAAAGKNPLRWDYWKCNCASRNNAVDVAIIDRSMDQTGMLFTEYVWGFNHI